MPMDSAPDHEMSVVNLTPSASVEDDLDFFLKLFPSLNDPNFKEYLEQLWGHPSFQLATQQFGYLLSPKTENEYDEHAYRIAMEEVSKTPCIKEGIRKLPPMPKDVFTFLNDLRALEKKLADESGAAITRGNKKILLQICDALVTMKKTKVEADESGDEEEALFPILHKNTALANVEGLNEALQGGTDMEEKDYMGRRTAFGKHTQKQGRPLEMFNKHLAAAQPSFSV